MVENEQAVQEEARPARKAKTGAWWKSLPSKAAKKTSEAPRIAPPARDEVSSVQEEKKEAIAPQAVVPDQDKHEAKTAPLGEPQGPSLAAESSSSVGASSQVPVSEDHPASVPTLQASPEQELSAVSPVQERKEKKPVTAPSAETKGVVTAEEQPAAQSPATPRDAMAKPSASEASSSVKEEGDSQTTQAAAKEDGSTNEKSAPATNKKRPRRASKKKARANIEEKEKAELDEETGAGEDEVEDETGTVEEVDAPPSKTKVHKLLINAEEPEECRIALLEDGRLESFHVTTLNREPTKNNIYKGRIVSIEANLQAAFVDIGTGRNGFLPFNEIHPEYYRQDVSERNRSLIAQHQWKKLKIEEVMQKGQEVLVQVVKEVTGNKGANMTTYLSLPGRCLVLMPGSDSAGISRKIVGEERRSALREIMSEFEIPEGIGYIIRTASAEITQNALEKDLKALLSLWGTIKKRGQTMEAPALIYEEQDTVVRFLRDHFFPEIQEILVDTQESLDNVNAFIELLPSKQQKVKVRLHKGSKPIFNQHNIEDQIESIYKPQVTLPSGGSIVINPTEALVAIDVNSGRTSKNSDFDETIFLANMEAAEELARQLRLRDLGGLIVVDFIDMRNKKHIRDVERQVKVSMKRDKAKVDISKISRFGLMQISRQKMGAPIEKGSYRTCEYCQGRGVVRSVETLSLYYLRRIQTGITRKKVARVECRFPLEVAQYLLNKKRAELTDLEVKHDAVIDIIPRREMKPAEHQIDFQES